MSSSDIKAALSLVLFALWCLENRLLHNEQQRTGLKNKRRERKKQGGREERNKGGESLTRYYDATNPSTMTSLTPLLWHLVTFHSHFQWKQYHYTINTNTLHAFTNIIIYVYALTPTNMMSLTPLLWRHYPRLIWCHYPRYYDVIVMKSYKMYTLT